MSSLGSGQWTVQGDGSLAKLRGVLVAVLGRAGGHVGRAVGDPSAGNVLIDGALLATGRGGVDRWMG